MVGVDVVKLIANTDITRYIRTLETPTGRLLTEAGFQLGDLTFGHYLAHYYSRGSLSGYSTHIHIDRGLRALSAWGIHPFPNEPERVWENLLYVAGRYLGIGPEPLRVDPPYVVLTTPDECERVINAFRFLDRVVEKIEKRHAA